MSHSINRNEVVKVHGIELCDSSVRIWREYAFNGGKPVCTTYHMSDVAAAKDKYNELCSQYSGVFTTKKIRS